MAHQLVYGARTGILCAVVSALFPYFLREQNAVSEPSLGQFWQTCGGAGELRLLIERAAQQPRGVVVPTPFAVIGRAETCDIVLDDEDISKRHAYLQVIDGRLWCFDLVSRTGTIWRQRRESVGWFDGAEGVRLGPFLLRTLARDNIAPSAVNPLLSVPPEHDVLPTLSLEFPHATTNGVAEAPTTWQLDRPLTYIGQSQLCKIRLRSPSVSRFHCSLLRTPHGVWLIDLLGREGVKINGAAFRLALLCDGDCLRVGDFEIRVHVESRRAPANSVMVPTNGAVVASRPLVDRAATVSSALATTAKPANLAPLPWPKLPPAQLPAPTAGTDSAQALLMAFANQFAQMQQQMFDQFQQTTVMMLQMFSSLQRDQFELIRQELEELRGLNREIHSLQIELAKHEAAPIGTANGRPLPAAPKFAATAIAPPALQPTSSKPEAAKSNPATEMPAPATPSISAPTSAPQVPAGHDVHAWLSQRFTDLQQERQSRWQKLVGTLLGK
jgi:pSer/pThr/pTyr-binding forkhead associated (FHA) protein